MSAKIAHVVAGLPFVLLGFFLLVYPLITAHTTSLTLVVAGGVAVFVGGYLMDPTDTEAIVKAVAGNLAQFFGRGNRD